MPISATIKSLLTMRGKTKTDLANLFGVSKQAISNKFTRDTWTASDLVRIAEFCGASIAFVSGDMVLPLSNEKTEE
ncbi:MAG: helix-turn-helix domain-containing protein [Oscillospiraceae bacterium]|nr:helix-turn-helix domain-containing protein [Oscillospiraceae bacterium]